ncbi:MAG: histidine phosphatase family protein [Candidatus Omnitrophota bacterium]|nr:histidine phosphatase family protein [Candidatus Omnitrophota bacterium]
MSTKLILIRHGETDWNLQGRYCGLQDVELNRKGKRQASLLYKRLKVGRIHKVYSSDRKRAIQTAKIVFKGLDIERLSDLREMHFGIFEGLTYGQITKGYPQIYKKWLDSPLSSNIPQGENFYSFRKRILKVVRKIVSLNYNKTIAIVCHGGTIGILINHILKSRDFWRHIPASSSLSIVEYKNGKPKIRLLNDISHLS